MGRYKDEKERLLVSQENMQVSPEFEIAALKADNNRMREALEEAKDEIIQHELYIAHQPSHDAEVRRKAIEEVCLWLEREYEGIPIITPAPTIRSQFPDPK